MVRLAGRIRITVGDYCNCFAAQATITPAGKMAVFYSIEEGLGGIKRMQGLWSFLLSPLHPFETEGCKM
jgi:hypothetical protein